ncbi:hypothetical protein GMSM_27320 [Geomonas sp. Red276]
MTVTSRLPGSLFAAPPVTEIPYRLLGRTGEKVSIVGVGGFQIGSQKDEKESIRIIRTAIGSGVNFMDNCGDYNDGESERRWGRRWRTATATGSS